MLATDLFLLARVSNPLFCITYPLRREEHANNNIFDRHNKMLAQKVNDFRATLDKTKTCHTPCPFDDTPVQKEKKLYLRRCAESRGYDTQTQL